VGVAELTRGADAVALLKGAEDAVRVSKAGGRNRTTCHELAVPQPA
jgi:PleD family two-component response regulator